MDDSQPISSSGTLLRVLNQASSDYTRENEGKDELFEYRSEGKIYHYFRI